MMRILFLADGRSPTTQRWLKGIAARGHETHLVSTYDCSPIPELTSFHILPVASGNFGGRQQKASVTQNLSPTAQQNNRKKFLRWLIIHYRPIFQKIRYYLGPLTLPAYSREFNRLIKSIQPDLVHALRIPFEGMLASHSPAPTPLVISTWGNDLTLHAHGSKAMYTATVRTLKRTRGLLSDASRDIRLAREMGLAANALTLVVPGAGGINLEEIRSNRKSIDDLLGRPVDSTTTLVVNPRGIRPAYVRNDIFFQAIPKVLQQSPKTLFICPAMAGDPEVERWVELYDIAANVCLLPALPQSRLWDIYRQAQVLISPSIHDGTPNSVLEGMASGCFPVVGDIESLREWITPGINGLLINPNDPQAVANGIIQGLNDAEMRTSAAQANLKLVSERAEYHKVMQTVETFYQRICQI
jgi:glycosyltransferase involved in cell wall biosynthesis